jgi:hypothetical protein
MQQHTDSVTTRGGAAVSGASVLVKTYPAGATATIYSDNGSTQQSNPITTDADGRFSFYAADGRYTLVISKSGVITQTTLTDAVHLWDPDDGTAEQDAADVAFLQSGSATSRTVAAKLQDIVCIKDFGASASASAAANTTAIQTAQTQCVSSGAALFVNRGRFEHSGLTFNEDWSGMMVFGEGVNESMLEYNGVGKAVQVVGQSSAYVNHFTWKDIGLVTDNTSAQAGQYHMYIQYCADSEFHNFYASYAGDTGLYLDGAVDRCRFFGGYIERSQTQAKKLATSISGGAGARSNENSFYGFTLWDNVAGIVIDNACYANRWYGLSIESWNAPYTGTAITVTSGRGNIFNNVYIEMKESASAAITGISMAATNSLQNAINGLFFGVAGVASGMGVTVISDSGIANEYRTIRTTDSTLAVQGTYTRFSFAATADGTIVDGAYNSGLSTPIDSINAGSTSRVYADEKLRYVEAVVAKTSDYTITGNDSGRVFTNNGAGAAVTFTLPSSTGLALGFNVTFMRNDAADAILIDPSAVGENIRGGGGGKYMSLDTNGACVKLIYTSGSGVWDIVHTNGTTSFEP